MGGERDTEFPSEESEFVDLKAIFYRYRSTIRFKGQILRASISLRSVGTRFQSFRTSVEIGTGRKEA